MAAVAAGWVGAAAGWGVLGGEGRTSCLLCSCVLLLFAMCSISIAKKKQPASSGCKKNRPGLVRHRRPRELPGQIQHAPVFVSNVSHCPEFLNYPGPVFLMVTGRREPAGCPSALVITGGTRLASDTAPWQDGDARGVGCCPRGRRGDD